MRVDNYAVALGIGAGRTAAMYQVTIPTAIVPRVRYRFESLYSTPETLS